MRKLLPLLAAMAVLACETGMPGTYDLVAVNDQEIPATLEFFGSLTLTSGSLTLSDSTYAVTITSSENDEDPETQDEVGTVTLDESNVIHFRPARDSQDPQPFEATWEGDQITLELAEDYRLIFRR